MGSHVWQRDAKKSTGGKTFAVGVPAIVPAPVPPPPKRRKLVWSRQDAAAARDAEAAATKDAGSAAQPKNASPGEANLASAADESAELAERRDGSAQAGPSGQDRAEAPRGPLKKRADAPALRASAEPKPTALDAALEARRKEMEALQRMIAEKKAERDGALKRQAEAHARVKSGELEAWRSQINSAFQSILASAKQDAAEDIAVQKVPVTYATRADIQRVLDAPDDYSVLQVQPDTSAAELRRRYRRLAVTLHPDKCATEGASEAFQRLVRAFQNLQDYAR
ncbi:hypothetical protein H632_c3p2 [Helicosporidium sp. ATCC 50920]|nr:hypothetical protein H632_c3p2 [Helicosporidium sp. ATCC 50920]|eukprot:KDD77178.1 hypothetical protein H632_c3p2 [Helicosporidium sp. ATCC 50920]